MTTLPGRPAVPEPHKHRTMAESFGEDAERYDRTRPAYPAELIERIVAESPWPDVLDVGCGTGIAARQFRAVGCRVLGVEPDPRMADFARRGGLTVEVSTFEDWDAAGRDFDTVVAGTAWHWVDPVAGPAKAAEVLRPGGRLAVFGHAFQLPPAVLDALAEVFPRVAPDLPFDPAPMRSMLDGYQTMYAGFADTFAAADAFGDVRRWRYDWERTYTRDEWLDQLPTQGFLTRLPPDRLGEVLECVGAAIDAIGGALTMPYATVAAVATRTGA